MRYPALKGWAIFKDFCDYGLGKLPQIGKWPHKSDSVRTGGKLPRTNRLMLRTDSKIGAQTGKWPHGTSFQRPAGEFARTNREIMRGKRFFAARAGFSGFYAGRGRRNSKTGRRRSSAVHRKSAKGRRRSKTVVAGGRQAVAGRPTAIASRPTVVAACRLPSQVKNRVSQAGSGARVFPAVVV